MKTLHARYFIPYTCILILVTIFTGNTGIAQKKTAHQEQKITSLRFLGEFDLPFRMNFKGTTVGGLSSIDYDAGRQVYYLISDDRSAINPARFYTAKIKVTTHGIDTVEIINVTTLKQKNEQPFPDSKTDPAHTPDPEGLRFDPVHQTMLWTSEGERIVKSGTTILEDPAITKMHIDGSYIDTFPLPDNMHMHSTSEGPRQNGVFEGLTFADHYNTLYVNVEEPLYQDGPRASLDTPGWIRIIKYDTRSKKPLAQYAYKIDPVAYPALTPNAFKINGVPDILAINNHQLLITERSFSTGRPGCVIRLYTGDLQKATNVASFRSLIGTSFVPVKKKMLFDFQTLGRYVDNVEGATFGPMLTDGHRSLILVVDDNFSPLEKTQFFLFEINP